MKNIILHLATFFLIACGNNENTNRRIDSPKNGTINISVDESFKPVIDEQLKMYKSTFPNTNIIVHYKSEVDCLKDLLKDSTRLIIISRGLTQNEINYFKTTLSFKPQFDVVAYDAVAAIINKENDDSLFTISDLKNTLSGKKDYKVILDGTNATSTVKYLQDSVLKGAKFGKNVVAVNGSEAVIEAIKNTKNAIGFVGNSWVSNEYDETQIQNLQQMKLALIECFNCGDKGFFAKASQATLSFGQYPLARPLYFIVKENWTGLGTGFTNFLSLERGQLIFRRSCLAPAKINLNKRSGSLSDK